jgi:hypothetical protein
MKIKLAVKKRCKIMHLSCHWKKSRNIKQLRKSALECVKLFDVISSGDFPLSGGLFHDGNS